MAREVLQPLHVDIRNAGKPLRFFSGVSPLTVPFRSRINKLLIRLPCLRFLSSNQ